MKSSWIITNRPQLFKEYKIVYQGNNFFVLMHEDKSVYKVKDSNIKAIILSGYVVPRQCIYNKYKNYSQFELIEKLFKEYGVEFVHYIKGGFNIIILKDIECIIVNDHHGIKKYYYMQNDRYYFVTNNLNSISSLDTVRVYKISASIMALFQHLIDGYTYFENIFYSKPATLLIIRKKLDIKIYWNRLSLISKRENKIDLVDIINEFKKIIMSYIDYLNYDNIHLTLTGGRDTRTILAALLSIDVKPKVFTFGYSNGIDVVVAKNISKQLYLEFHNPYIASLSMMEYQLLVNKILEFGNPLLNLHRAHRLDAITKQKQRYGTPDILFLGAMGGDYIKGVKYDDYIVSIFLRKLFFKNMEIEKLAEAILIENSILYNKNSLEELLTIIKSTEFIQTTDLKVREFLVAFDLIGGVHDYQDISIFFNYTGCVICPFMDIDFLEFLFCSNYSLFNHDYSTKNIFKRIKGGEMQVHMISNYYPHLAEIPFANGYTGKDLLGNQWLYILKRIYFKYWGEKSLPTFSYETWFNNYVKNEIHRNREVISEYYDIKKIKQELNNQKHMTHEGYWHKFSNPVNFGLYVNNIIQ